METAEIGCPQTQVAVPTGNTWGNGKLQKLEKKDIYYIILQIVQNLYVPHVNLAQHIKETKIKDNQAHLVQQMLLHLVIL